MTTSIEWALARLRQFEADAKPVYVPSPSGTAGFHSYKPTASPDDVLKSSAIVEQILDKYLPGWRQTEPNKSERYRFRVIYEATQRCIATLEARDEIAEHLKDRGPSLDAESLHSWVWEAAKPAWDAGLHEDAVDAAARSVNTRLRGKVSRRDLGEGDLIGQVFSQRPGDENNPRLRLPLPEASADKTIKAIYTGISQFGQGLFGAVRNPLAHEAPGHSGMTEEEALETLAAFSLLARWIDRASVLRG